MTPTPAGDVPPAADRTRHTFRFDGIGTRWEVETDQPLPADLRRDVAQRVELFDRTYSRFRPDSLVSQVATAPHGGTFDFPDDAIDLFDLYDRLGAATAGAVDPLVGRDLELLGYDASYSLTPAPAAVLDQRRRPAWPTDVVRKGQSIRTRKPLVIDVGAAGKGYLVDLALDLLRQAGITWLVVDGGGDLRHAGTPGIRVGLEHPSDPRLVVGTADLHGQALCASAVNRRAWGDGLHHLLDARTGRPVQDVVATWVTAETAAMADGLATALFCADPEHLSRTFRFQYVRILADGRADVSPDFPGEVYVK